MNKSRCRIALILFICFLMFFDAKASNFDISYTRFGISSSEQAELKTVVEKFATENIKDDMSDFEKEIRILKYIISNVKTDSYNYYLNNVPTHALNAYGALVKGSAICEGYADAFDLLCKTSGLKSEIVHGKVFSLSPDGTEKWINHSWNRVMLDEDFYNVDVFWEDIDSKPFMFQNEYMNLTDQELRKDHKWSGGRLCTSKKYGKEFIGTYLKTLTNNK